MATKPAGNVPEERLEQYERIVAMVPGVERKGASIPYTSLHGNMFSYLDGGSLVLRLGPDDRAAFLEEFGTQLHQAYGIVQKEYVDVPDSLLADTESLRRWFAASHAYAATLRPKPTTRKK